MPRRNPETLVDVPTNVGVISIIDTARRTGRPAGLRKPWDYMLSIPEITSFANAFRPLYNEVAQDQRSPDAFEGPDRARENYVPPKGEICIWRKPTGIEFHASITGTSTFTSEARWNEICTRFQQIITDHLGADAEAFLDDYEPSYYTDAKRPEDRCYELYARFDTHIYFSEYMPIQQASRQLDRLVTGEE